MATRREENIREETDSLTFPRSLADLTYERVCEMKRVVPGKRKNVEGKLSRVRARYRKEGGRSGSGVYQRWLVME